MIGTMNNAVKEPMYNSPSDCERQMSIHQDKYIKSEVEALKRKRQNIESKGGYAYPQTKETGMVSMDTDGRTTIYQETVGGATMLDYFAAKALQGLLSSPDGSKDPATVCKQALKYGQEMIKQKGLMKDNDT